LTAAHALILTRIHRAAATQFLRQFERSDFLVVRASEDDEEAAKAIVYRYDDKDFSLVDATSFALMRRLGIDEALAYDHNFEQFGFRLARA